MHPLRSLQARSLQFKLNHFNLFPEGGRLKQLRSIHSGKRCFIIGNGPSLRAEDLTTLHRAGDITFAFNRIYHIFSETPWRPTYYISQDMKMLSGCQEEVERLEAGAKFIPAELKWYYDIHLSGITPFHIKNEEQDGFPTFSDDISKQVINSLTVVYSAIQIAAYMGIREMYLIGVDHHFRTSMNADGQVVIDPTAKDYFCEQYNQDKDQLYIPNTDKSTLTFLAAKKHCDARGIRIFNATRGGKLEVFPRVDFDRLFTEQENISNATGHS